MFSQVPICALNQPDRNYVTTEIKGADCHACLNSASVSGMERVRNTWLWITKPQLRTQQYVSQAYQTLQTIIKLTLESQVAQAWNMSIGIVA